jgi:hypothetical protein
MARSPQRHPPPKPSGRSRPSRHPTRLEPPCGWLPRAPKPPRATRPSRPAARGGHDQRRDESGANTTQAKIDRDLGEPHLATLSVFLCEQRLERLGAEDGSPKTATAADRWHAAHREGVERRATRLSRDLVLADRLDEITLPR